MTARSIGQAGYLKEAGVKSIDVDTDDEHEIRTKHTGTEVYIYVDFFK